MTIYNTALYLTGLERRLRFERRVRKVKSFFFYLGGGMAALAVLYTVSLLMYVALPQ